MRKSVVLTIVAVSAILVGVGSILSAKSPKFSGVLRISDGVIYSDADLKTKKSISNSIDPVTAIPTKKFTPDVYNLNDDLTVTEAGTKKQKKIKFDLDKKKALLSFEYIEKDDKIVEIPNEDNDYRVISIPNSTKNILEYNDSLYSLDLVHGSIENLLNDTYEGYTQEALRTKEEKQHIANFSLTWAERATINPNGKYLLFFSNRNDIATGNSGGSGQIWVKDLQTNVETPIYNSWVEVAGWGLDNKVYVKDFDRLIEIDYVHHTSSIVKENSSVVLTVAYPYVIDAQLGEIVVSNLRTGTSTTYSDGIGRVDMIVPNNAKTQVAMLNMGNPNKGGYEIVVIKNFEKMEVQKIQPDTDYDFDNLSWIDDHRLMAISRKLGSIEQKSYVVDVN